MVVFKMQNFGRQIVFGVRIYFAFKYAFLIKLIFGQVFQKFVIWAIYLLDVVRLLSSRTYAALQHHLHN